MKYRKLGNTGMDVSVIGLGPEHLFDKPYSQVEEVIHGALDRGVNIMDFVMPHEQVRKYIGKALKCKRDKMIIQGHIGSVLKDGQFDICRDLPKCKEYFEDLMRQLDTDYIDIGMLFYIDSEDDFRNIFEGGIADYAQELKQKGVIRKIGFNSHNPLMAKKAVGTGIVDMMMFSINPAYDMLPAGYDINPIFIEGKMDYTKDLIGIDPVRMELYRLCEREGVGITVMKAYGGGKLLSGDFTPFSRPLTPGQCIHFALTRPGVSSVLVGIIHDWQLEEAVKYFDLTEEELDYSDAVAQYNSGISGECVYCNHCQPCPIGIDVATVTKFLDIAKQDESNIPPTLCQHYGALEHKGGECAQCGNCETRCPFSVKIVENMEKAKLVFGE